MSDRKYELCYIVSRRNTHTQESIPCAIFHAKDMEDAQNTCDGYNQDFKDKGITEYVFELHCTALYE